MKNIIFITLTLLLLVCIVLNVFLLLKYKVVSNQYLRSEKELSETRRWTSHLNAVYNNKTIETITEYYPLSKHLIVWNESGKYCNISDVLSKRNKMVFYFSENHCSDCIKDALNQIKNIPDSISLNNYLILCNYLNTRNFHVFLNEYDLKIPVYNISGQGLDIPVENMDVPFFFITNSDLRCKQVFIPVKEIENYTANHLQRMNKKYGSNATQ